MMRITILCLASLLFAAAGCGVAPGESPSAPSAAQGLASDTSPDARDVAEKLTRDLRLSGDAAGGSTAGAGDVSGAVGAFSDIEVIVRCNRKCVMGCGDLSDEACAASCCTVTTR